AACRGLTAAQVEDRTVAAPEPGQFDDMARTQARRLEQAMVAGRRWGADEFTTFVVRHPLLGLLARQTLWGAYDERGRLQGAIRIPEGGACVDLRGQPCTPQGRIGIVHPLHLNASERAAWMRVFGGLKISPPFPQLDRAVHTLRPGEESAHEWTRFGGT